MIDWNENAISAVKEFYRWANLKHRAGCSADTDKFFSELDVNRPTQKTVADAVEHCNGVWPEDEPDDFVCVWNNKGGRFEFWCEGYAPVGYYHQVCTRAEFEAYLAGVEPVEVDIDKDALKAQYKSAVKGQEDEKWTHTWNGRKCRVVFTEDCTSWIKFEGLKNAIAKTDDLKPIKPTLTKADFADFVIEKLNDGTHQSAVCYMLQEKLDTHDII